MNMWGFILIFSLLNFALFFFRDKMTLQFEAIYNKRVCKARAKAEKMGFAGAFQKKLSLKEIRRALILISISNLVLVSLVAVLFYKFMP